MFRPLRHRQRVSGFSSIRSSDEKKWRYLSFALDIHGVPLFELKLVPETLICAWGDLDAAIDTV